VPNRREFLKSIALAGVGGLAAADVGWAQPTRTDPWVEAAAILHQIVPPTFPDRTFDVTRFGASARSDVVQAAAIRAAIAACAAAGGGRVVVPAGRFVTGPIVLRSNVNLHLLDGAMLAFSQDPRAYLGTLRTKSPPPHILDPNASTTAMSRSSRCSTRSSPHTTPDSSINDAGEIVGWGQFLVSVQYSSHAEMSGGREWGRERDGFRDCPR